jgi:hypothetical protein
MLLAACGGSASEPEGSTVSEPGTTSALVDEPSSEWVPPTEAPSLIAAAEHELALVDEMWAELGVAEVLGSEGEALLMARREAETEFGEAMLSAVAAELGLDVTAAAGLTLSLVDPPHLADWTGSMLGDTSATGSMTMGLLTLGMESADEDRPMTRVERTETYTKQLSGLTETITITSQLGLQTGQGRMRGEVRIDSISTIVNAAGETVGTMHGTAEGTFEALACPDPDGVADGRYQLALSQSYTHGGPAVSSTRHIDAPFTLTADDNAKLVGARFVASVEASGRVGGENPWSASVTVPVTILGPAQGTVSESSTNASPEQVRSATGTAYMPYIAIGLAATAAEKFWRSGKCINVTTSEESRKVTPGETVTIDVTSKQKFDGQTIDRPIKAAFTGKSLLEPANTPLDPPASFTFTAGAQPGDKGKIDFEQKSKRGIGKKTLEFEVEPQNILVTYTGTWGFAGGDSTTDLRWEGRIQLIGGRGETEAFLTITGGALQLTLCPTEIELEVPIVVTAEVDEADSELIRLYMAGPPPPEWDVSSCAAAAQMEAEIALAGWTAGLQGPIAVRVGETVDVSGSPMSAAQVSVTRADP